MAIYLSPISISTANVTTLNASSGTFSITSLPSLIAGTAVIGKVGIDQTTPGTTNLVSAGQNGAWNITNISGTISLPTGAATQTTLAAIDTKLGGTLTINTHAVTQSGTWSVGVTNTTAAAPISVRLSDGSAFYTASGGGSGGTGTTGAAVPSTAFYSAFNSGGNLVGVSATSPLPIMLSTNTVVSSGNSTTTLLGASATFTGAWEDVLDYGEMRINATSAQSSATDGFIIQQSADGTNVDATDAYTLTGPGSLQISIPPGYRYARVVYTNGAVAQSGRFQIQALYNKIAGNPSSQRPADNVSNQRDMVETLAYPMVYNSLTGAWDRDQGRAVDQYVTGNLAALNAAATVTGFSGGTAGINITGTFVGTYSFEASNDGGTTWHAAVGSAPANGTAAAGATAVGNYQLGLGGKNAFRVRMSAYTSGTCVVAIRVTPGDTAIVISNSLPQGSNIIGNVGINGTPAVTITSGTVTTVSGITAMLSQGAAGATAAGNPLRTALLAKTANPTAVTDGQAVNMQGDKVGRLVTAPFAVRDLISSATVTLTTTTETSLIAAVAATFNDIVSISFFNSSATGTTVSLRNVTAGTVVWTGYLPATSAGAINFPVPMKQATVNTAWTAQLGTAVTDVRINVQYVANI